ncbi:hypothetical protein [Alkaliflexus imshenetskii]|uniref:hypothetical protein n=1 Tax=Alkaliflexus imshenetskii TaxID=286730 RepID=UPI0004787A28|nr:hypothetical protein [Alkaliflexus imshenetskii]
MDKVLKARHWQLFLFVFIIPFALFLSAFMVPLYFFNGAWLFFALPVAIVIAQLTLYLWMWSVGTVVYRRFGLQQFFSNGLFRSLIIVPVVMILLVMAFWIWGASILSMGKFSMANTLTGALWILIPLQMVLIISKFYCFYFTAKVLRSAELQKPAVFDELISEFILMIIFPVGLWFLQPRINGLMSK